MPNTSMTVSIFFNSAYTLLNEIFSAIVFQLYTNWHDANSVDVATTEDLYSMCGV